MNALKNVVITGASRGIGLACARKFSTEGFGVYAVARSADRLDALCSEMAKKPQNGPILPLPCDLAKQKDVRQLCERLIQESPLPDGYVFNAGYAASKSFRASHATERKREMMLNYFSPAAMLEALLPAYESRGGATFIAVGSISSVTAFPGNASYAASKAALTSLWRSLDIEYADSKNQFGLVMPGLTDTDMVTELDSILPRRSAESTAELIFGNYQKPCLDQTIGLENQAALLLNRLAPRPVDRVMKVLGRLVVPK